MKRLIPLVLVLVLILAAAPAHAQKQYRLSVATGGTGGVYYPLGGGIANVISKHVPEAEATAEVTAASVDNCLLVGAKKADMALVMADVGFDAAQAQGKFKEKLPLRTLAVLYPNTMHIVTLEGKGIETVADLKGKRVSTGAPGSGTEVKCLRILEAHGINPDKDITRDRLGASESAGALKDGKIDAYFWDGGIPTASITDLGATPGVTLKLINHGDAVAKMTAKYGPLYSAGVIPAKSYPGQEKDVTTAEVWNVLVCNAEMKDEIAYKIVKTLFEKKDELVAVHKAATDLKLESQAGGSSLPFHPGALKYYKEKGLAVK